MEGEKVSHDPQSEEPPYAKYLSRLIRPFSNFDFFFIKGVRERAVRALRLKSGGKVLDLGCGGGGSFPHLVKAVGSGGKVAGVDISPQSCVNARRRVRKNGWKNVEVIDASADSVEFVDRFDGALMFAAPDVYASERAIANIFPYFEDNARVALFGAKLSDGRLRRLLNPFFLFMCRKLSPATPIPDATPWALIARRLENLNVEELFFGSMFLVSGTVRGVGAVQDAMVTENAFCGQIPDQRKK